MQVRCLQNGPLPPRGPAGANERRARHTKYKRHYGDQALGLGCPWTVTPTHVKMEAVVGENGPRRPTDVPKAQSTWPRRAAPRLLCSQPAEGLSAASCAGPRYGQQVPPQSHQQAQSITAPGTLHRVRGKGRTQGPGGSLEAQHRPGNRGGHPRPQGTCRELAHPAGPKDPQPAGHALALSSSRPLGTRSRAPARRQAPGRGRGRATVRASETPQTERVEGLRGLEPEKAWGGRLGSFKGPVTRDTEPSSRAENTAISGCACCAPPPTRERRSPCRGLGVNQPGDLVPLQGQLRTGGPHAAMRKEAKGRKR